MDHDQVWHRLLHRKQKRRSAIRLTPGISSRLSISQGNTAFKAQKYPEAIGHYTAAILADGNDPTFPLNRAAAYLKLGKYALRYFVV